MRLLDYRYQVPGTGGIFTQETKVPCIALQFLVRFQPVFVLQIQPYLVLGVATFSNTRHRSFDFFQYKVIYHSNTRFTLYWQKVGMSSPIQSENVSGYHYNSRCSFVRISSNTRYSSLYWALFISQYKVAIFCNSRLSLY